MVGRRKAGRRIAAAAGIGLVAVFISFTDPAEASPVYWGAEIPALLKAPPSLNATWLLPDMRGQASAKAGVKI